MKIRIKSSGTVPTTRIENAETGELIADVVRVVWECDVSDMAALATLTFRTTPVDILAEVQDNDA